MSVDEFLGNKTGKKGLGTDKAVNKTPVKYRNPDNSAEQWTGRGRRPKWVVDALDSGKIIEDMSVCQRSERAILSDYYAQPSDVAQCSDGRGDQTKTTAKILHRRRDSIE
jgi:hypothetical protein